MAAAHKIVPVEDDVDDEEEEDEYEVETIMHHRQKAGRLQYLVSWRGYGPEHDTWEPEDHVSHAEDVVSQYWAKVRKTEEPPVTKKRGRLSKDSVKASATPKPESKPAKKARPSASTSVKEKGSVKKSIDDLEVEELNDSDAVDEQVVEDLDEQYSGSLVRYHEAQDWEDLVKSLDTTEGKGEDGVFFATMVGGEKVKIPRELAYKRCPQKCCKYFEGHLSFRRPDE